ncbi:ABC transporter substrate-binding protein/permease [soil metagenome]
MEQLAEPSSDPSEGRRLRGDVQSPGLPEFILPLRWLVPLVFACLTLGLADRSKAEGTLEHIRNAGRLVYGCDMEGGGPFAYIDPNDPSRVVGFEVELMEELARELGPQAVLSQGQWDMLLNVLTTGHVDMVVNGYELTSSRTRDYLPTRPYYVFQLQLMVKRGSSIRSWADLREPKPGGGPWRVGVLGGSSAETFAKEEQDGTVQVRSYTGATDAMLQVASGQLDATLQDLPAARFYRHQYPSIELVGPPEGHGYYVIYVRKQDVELAEALKRGITRLVESGELRRVYEKYDIWTDAQQELYGWNADPAAIAASRSTGQETARGWPLVWKYRDALLRASGMTIFLSISAMPLAIAVGLGVALGRLYGPAPLRIVLAAYVEIVRGTPLMLQLFVLFYLANLPPIVAGIMGLAINYSAYEAEIYRAGLQAIPGGQMEASLALGMSRRLALRRVIVPQAVRIVIPPVTNDFIALFKDSSVCSVITLVELSKQYQILANSTGGVVEFALACAFLYLAMSLPLSWLSRWSERRLSGAGLSRGAPA